MRARGGELVELRRSEQQGNDGPASFRVWIEGASQKAVPRARITALLIAQHKHLNPLADSEGKKAPIVHRQRVIGNRQFPFKKARPIHSKTKTRAGRRPRRHIQFALHRLLIAKLQLQGDRPCLARIIGHFRNHLHFLPSSRCGGLENHFRECEVSGFRRGHGNEDDPDLLRNLPEIDRGPVAALKIRDQVDFSAVTRDFGELFDRLGDGGIEIRPLLGQPGELEVVLQMKAICSRRIKRSRRRRRGDDKVGHVLVTEFVQDLLTGQPGPGERAGSPRRVSHAGRGVQNDDDRVVSVAAVAGRQCFVPEHRLQEGQQQQRQERRPHEHQQQVPEAVNRRLAGLDLPNETNGGKNQRPRILAGQQMQEQRHGQRQRAGPQGRIGKHGHTHLLLRLRRYFRSTSL